MTQYFAVEGRLPKGKRFRGVVGTTADGIVTQGPQALCGGPWAKRPLRLPELRKFARVEHCPRPRLTSHLKAHLEHKFHRACDHALTRGDSSEQISRGKTLLFIEEILDKRERDGDANRR
jgi:hypothetical protein